MSHAIGPNPKEARAERTNKVVIALIGAAAGIITAAAALFTALRASDSQIVTGPAPAGPTVTQTVTVAPTSTVTETSGESGGPQSTDPEPIRRRGTVTLVEGGEPIYLDASPSDSRWGKNETGYSETRTTDDGRLYIQGGWIADLEPGLEPRFAVCTARTDWGGQDNNNEFYLPLTRLERGQHCFKWSTSGARNDERFARIVLKNQTGDRATFDITIWEDE